MPPSLSPGPAALGTKPNEVAPDAKIRDLCCHFGVKSVIYVVILGWLWGAASEFS